MSIYDDLKLFFHLTIVLIGFLLFIVATYFWILTCHFQNGPCA